MADKSNDASNGNGESAADSIADKFAGLKTQYEAEESGRNASDVDEEEDKTNTGDAEADNADDAANDTGTDDSDDDSTDDSTDDAAGDNDKGKQGSEFRLTQFKGEKGTTEEYTKNLEDGYLNSTQEALKLKDQKENYERQVNAVMAAAKKDPEFGEKLLSLLNDNGGTNGGSASGANSDFGDKATQTSNNPFLVHAETEWNQNNDKSVKDFVEAHPEVLTDPKINADVKRWAQVYTKEVFEADKRLITTGEAMEMAYRQLGLSSKQENTQSLVDGMKKNAAPSRPQTAKKKSSGKSGGDTKQFSDATLTFAQKMGISKERLVKGSKR